MTSYCKWAIRDGPLNTRLFSTLHMVALHGRHLHDMDKISTGPQYIHFLSQSAQ